MLPKVARLEASEPKMQRKAHGCGSANTASMGGWNVRFGLRSDVPEGRSGVRLRNRQVGRRGSQDPNQPPDGTERRPDGQRVPCASGRSPVLTNHRTDRDDRIRRGGFLREADETCILWNAENVSTPDAGWRGWQRHPRCRNLPKPDSGCGMWSRPNPDTVIERRREDA